MTARARKWLRRSAWLAGGTAVFVLAAHLLMFGLMWHWVARPPELPPEASATAPAPQERDGRVWLGRCWLGKREGIQVLYLTGTPYEMGYANGVLAAKLIQRQEEAMMGLLNQVAPWSEVQFLLKFLVTYKNRGMPACIAPEYQMEMLGISRGYPDPRPDIGPLYHRILNYHAAQDISYMLMNSPLIRRGCTSFGAWGGLTSGGHLMAGRNFDWEAHPVFDQDRLLVICEPKDGIPFVSLSWAGMVGCVSGMNREGLLVCVNGAPSRLPDAAATPTCLVAREALQNARDIAGAVEIIRKRQVFVSSLFLVGSRADGRFVVVEKTPEQTAVREAETPGSIVCANHYMTPGLRESEINHFYTNADTSLSRFDRLTERLAAAGPGTIDAPACASILRDRLLPGGVAGGNGHRGTLNPLIATHSIIADLTDGLFWAAAPPHQLGRYVAFDVARPEALLPERAIGPDPILADGVYDRWLAAEAALDQGRRELKAGHFEAAARAARAAETNNPGFYRNAWLLAESLRGLGQTNEALAACRTAMSGRPALGGEREKIKALADGLGGGK